MKCVVRSNDEMQRVCKDGKKREQNGQGDARFQHHARQTWGRFMVRAPIRGQSCPAPPAGARPSPAGCRGIRGVQRRGLRRSERRGSRPRASSPRSRPRLSSPSSPRPRLFKERAVSDVSKGMEKGREELTDERGRGRQLVDTIHERQASVCARCEDVC